CSCDPASFCSACLMSCGPHGATLFPYTTLFRSQVLFSLLRGAFPERLGAQRLVAVGQGPAAAGLLAQRQGPRQPLLGVVDIACRSEEHTSELQSRENLVCRLLLEKKNGHGQRRQ